MQTNINSFVQTATFEMKCEAGTIRGHPMVEVDSGYS